MKKAAMIGFGLCALGVAMEPLSATVFPVVGYGSGDYSVEARCRPKQMDYLVGFKAGTGMWMDRITPLCAPLISAVQFGAKRELKPRGGGGGTSEVEQYCDNGEVISAIDLIFRPHLAEVQRLEFVCSSMKTWAARTISIGPKSGDEVPIAPVQQCPYGEVASGITVHWGRYVNAIGLICDKFNVPVATQTSSPPPSCDDRCAPLLTSVHPQAEANRVHQNCMALCTSGANATITCPNGTTVKGTAPCK
jgi:hypothetical protein